MRIGLFKINKIFCPKPNSRFFSQCCRSFAFGGASKRNFSAFTILYHPELNLQQQYSLNHTVHKSRMSEDSDQNLEFGFVGDVFESESTNDKPDSGSSSQQSSGDTSPKKSPRKKAIPECFQKFHRTSQEKEERKAERRRERLEQKRAESKARDNSACPEGIAEATYIFEGTT